MALSTVISLTIRASLTGAGTELAQAAAPINIAHNLTWANGTGLNQASQIFADTRQLAASATEDLDLAGVLTNAFGATITFTKIKGIFVRAHPTNTNNVIVGGAASNQLINWVGAATHTVIVQPGGIFSLFNPTLAGYAVTAGTGDLLRIGNSAAGSVVDYDVVLIGA